MIGSLFPSAFSNAHQSGHDRAELRHGERAVADGRHARSSDVKDLESRMPEKIRDRVGAGEHGVRAGTRELFHAAKGMIKDALKDFGREVRDALGGLGFDPGMVKDLVRGVMQAAKDALRTGADFSANLMVAAVSQTTTMSSAGTSSSFSLFASEIEIAINHSTGEVSISATKVSIEGQVSQTGGTAAPRLVDGLDSDIAAVSPLDALLQAFEDSDALLGTDEEPVDDQPVVLPPEPGAADDVAETPPDADAPVSMEPPLGTARIVITAFERFMNDRNERITYLRFDATIPLALKPAEPPAEPVTPPAEIPAPVEPTTETAPLSLIA